MKKVVFIIFSLVLCLVVSTGCEASKSDRKNLLNVLKNNLMIDKNAKEVGTFKDVKGYFDATPLYGTYYVYETRSGLVAVHYENNGKESSCRYAISIYSNIVSEVKDVEEYNEVTGTNTITSKKVYSKSKDTRSVSYCATETFSFLGLKTYSIKPR